MTQKTDLRERARAIMAAEGDWADSLSVDGLRDLARELRLHQIELELQNEQLNMTLLELTEAHDLYFDLYESASVGFATLGSDFRVLRVNRAAATMLGVGRQRLMGGRIEACLGTASADRCFLAFRRVAQTGRARTEEVSLARGDEARSLSLEISALPVESLEEGSLRLTMCDITEVLNRRSAPVEAEPPPLHELINVCSACRKIRDDAGVWRDAEAFWEARLGTMFSHGLCKSCLDRLFPEPDSG